MFFTHQSVVQLHISRTLGTQLGSQSQESLETLILKALVLPATWQHKTHQVDADILCLDVPEADDTSTTQPARNSLKNTMQSQVLYWKRQLTKSMRTFCVLMSP